MDNKFKAICIDNFYFGKNYLSDIELVIGNIYEDCITGKKVSHIPVSFMMPLAEWREKQINEILK